VSTQYLRLGDALRVITAVLGGAPSVRDVGLLQSALLRPATSVFGREAYPTVHEKAAALLHSIVSNHPLVDGNKRAGFACAAVFLTINGHRLTLGEDAAYDLVMEIARGDLTNVKAIARRLCR